jgi:hypothetical protein
MSVVNHSPFRFSVTSAIFLFAFGICSADELKIAPIDDGLRVKVVARLPSNVIGTEEVAKQLKLALVDSEGNVGPSILGKYQSVNGLWTFTHRYRLAHDQLYRAQLSRTANELITREYRTPRRKPTAAPVVARVFPSQNSLPANHLKFYVYFSKPMREGKEIFDLVQLFDENGDVIAAPWRRAELWDADAQRLTLWIHPGRIKTGVNLREDEGPVLKAGHQYSLVFDRSIRDSEGNSLASRFAKKFRAIAADQNRPLPSQWKVTSPAAQSREALQISFAESLDYALLFRYLTVFDDQGNKVDGEIKVGVGESSWEFQPRKPWQLRKYQIKVNGLLEDLAGNTPVRLFDTDLQKPAPSSPTLKLFFSPQ